MCACQPIVNAAKARIIINALSARMVMEDETLAGSSEQRARRIDATVNAPAQARRFSQARSARSNAMLEDYTELIDDLSREFGEARTADIARRLGVAHPTATKALARLKREGLAVSRPYRGVFLTPAGAAMAGRVARAPPARRRDAESDRRARGGGGGRRRGRRALRVGRLARSLRPLSAARAAGGVGRLIVACHFAGVESVSISALTKRPSGRFSTRRR